ncbi:MAG: amidohydrolase family protein, partial [Longimicrobiales bacterium]
MRRTRYRARWVLPIAGPPIRDGALLVDEQGRIAEVGADAHVARPDDAESIDLGVSALMPGLVNAHAHPELTALRGILEDLPFETWIPTLRDIKVRASLSADDLQLAALWQLAEAYAAGITTVAATEDSSAAFDALRASGGRGVVYREVFGPAPGQCTAAVEGLKANVEALRARANDLVTVGVSPHAAYTVSDVLFRTVAEYAHAQGLPVAVHVAESAAESALVADATGPFAARLQQRGIAIDPRARSPIALLEQTGILALRPLLIHCVQIDAADIAAIAAAGASMVHCPVANARLGHGIAPVVELHMAGVNVALGSDSMASNNRMDLLEEARIAQLMQR